MPLNDTQVPLEKTPNGKVRLEPEKSRSSRSSMTVCNVLPAALLNKPMRSSGLATVSQETVEMSESTTMKQERKQSMRVLERRGEKWDKKGGRHSKQWKRKVDGWFEVAL